MNSLFTDFKEVSTSNFLIRNITSKDYKDVFEIYSDKAVMKYDSKNILTSIEETTELINKGIKNRWFIRFSIVDKLSENVIGTIALHHFDFENQNAQIGYNLKPQHWNKGIMSEVLPCMLEYIKTNTNMKKLEASINKENLASIKLAEKLGFTTHQTLDKDLLVFSKSL